MKIVVDDDGISLSGSVQDIILGYISLSEEISELLNRTTGKSYTLAEMFEVLNEAAKKARKITEEF
jgi:hypothetical protein